MMLQNIKSRADNGTTRLFRKF